MPNGDEFLVIEREFQTAGIDVNNPGFCDSAAFLRAEEDDPDLLLRYARYIRQRPYQQQYADRVRTRARQVTEFFADELARDGRRGACLDACSVALKFLEHEDIWGYAAIGSTVIEFVNPLGRRVVIHHITHPNNPARAGHAWLCVPPFDIVDLTLPWQPVFTAGERALLEQVAVEDAGNAGLISIDELVEPELRQLHQELYGRPGVIEDFASPTLRDYWTRVPPRIVTLQHVRLRYIECGISSGDGAPLEQMRNLVLSGRNPGELHTEYLRRYPRPQ